MIHFLYYRGTIIVDVDAMKDDLRVVVVLKSYSDFLLNNLDKKDEIIADFSRIDELRGEYFERAKISFWAKRTNPDELCKTVLKEIAAKYRLSYMTD